MSLSICQQSCPEAAVMLAHVRGQRQPGRCHPSTEPGSPVTSLASSCERQRATRLRMCSHVCGCRRLILTSWHRTSGDHGDCTKDGCSRHQIDARPRCAWRPTANRDSLPRLCAGKCRYRVGAVLRDECLKGGWEDRDMCLHDSVDSGLIDVINGTGIRRSNTTV
jgi:hypothetical protein